MKDSILGLSISDRAVQAVELERDAHSNTLLAIDEWENSFPGAQGENMAAQQQFQEYLSAFLKVNHIKARRVSVALDTSLMFLHSIPFEAGLSRNEVTDHVKWELTQYFPDLAPKDFVTDVHIIVRHQSAPWNTVLGVSVRRTVVEAIHASLRHLGLDLHILDADHFSADMALRANYPDTYRRYLALVGVKEDRLDISLMKNGNLESYSYHVVHSNQEIVDTIARYSREAEGVYSITTYGPYLDKDLLVQIRRGSALLVEALNPLRHVNVSDSLRLADHLTVPSYRFASAVGVALRRD
jgi:Tfp pilus assembly PilM family ATPase